MGEVIVDQVLLNPGPVLIEGAGAAWGGLWGDVTLLAVAMEGLCPICSVNSEAT